jgi:hypothetical protein
MSENLDVPNGIGVYRETSLHASLKKQIAQPGDRLEEPLGKYIVDVFRIGHVYEIQTGSFSQISRKLSVLLNSIPVTLVYPVPFEKWLVYIDQDGQLVNRRKSPRRGRWEDIFYELIRIPRICLHPNFSLLILLIQEDVILQKGPGGSWRRKGWKIIDRKLLEIVDQKTINYADDYLQVLPENLLDPFTNHDLAASLVCQRSLATRITYTLRQMDLLKVIDKKGRSNLLSRNITLTEE